MDSHTFHSALRWSHIVAGAIGLIVFWLPVFARKGNRLHRTAGRIFVFLSYFISATAAISCGWGLVAPISFTGITRELNPNEVATLSANVRFLFSILGTLMLFLVAGTQLGVYSMRTKGRHDPARIRVLAFHVLAVFGGVALFLYGAWQWWLSRESRYFVCLALGAIFVLDSKKVFRYLARDWTGTKQWWYVHMECMLGAGIAFYTAFAVFGFSRLTNLQLEGSFALVPWILPSAIGIPATSVWIRHYRKKFGETSESAEEKAEVSGVS